MLMRRSTIAGTADGLALFHLTFPTWSHSLSGVYWFSP
jgi:hypothetical protein